ncbi:MAG TPA: ATP-dependent DNA ligase [Candidatus Acidoferrales bacterium]|nr:ATP-dependent DNA ligase [Candidatus Acidoferrales bacterium]
MTPRARRLHLPLQPPYPPMETLSVDAIPTGKEWLYEPKWDGFRALAFRDGDEIQLQSKNGLPLARYFPEVIEHLRALKAQRFVLDGELVIRVGSQLSFEELQMRIHPAESRVRKLAQEHPATLLVFDLLVDQDGELLTERPLRGRRPKLEAFARRFFTVPGIRLSKASTQRKVVDRWFAAVGGALDGIIAKRLDCEYRSGDRKGAVKVKKLRTADCVVGGFRYATNAKVIGSLLLGLYDAEGKLNHVGFTSGLSDDQRKELVRKLKPLIAPPGFTGRAPGGPSRWSTDRSEQWEPLKTKLVVEVSYDHVSDERFRHGTRLLRWRLDKAPRQCTMDQIENKAAVSIMKLST